jgi:hypothetical protein
VPNRKRVIHVDVLVKWKQDGKTTKRGLNSNIHHGNRENRSATDNIYGYI